MIHKKDTVYFMVSYLDDDSVFPIMETVVYLGEEKTAELGIRHMYQDLESWKERGAHPNNEEGPGKVFSLPAGELSNIHNFETALKELAGCLSRRQKRGLA